MTQTTDIAVLRRHFSERVTGDPDYRQRVLVRLHELQTPTERKLRITTKLNGVGFSAPDASRLSPLAEQILAGESVSIADEETLKMLLPKYWGQFTITTLSEPKKIAIARKNGQTCQGAQTGGERAA